MDQVLISIEEVKAKIESAFSDVQFPGDEYLLTHVQDEFEIADFLGKNWQKWQDVPWEIIDYNYCDLPFFGPLAMRFFLPAYLICSLYGVGSNTLTFTMYSLMGGDEPYQQEFFFSWVNQLNFEQKSAITLFLKYVKQMKLLTSNDAEEALQRYWGKIETALVS